MTPDQWKMDLLTTILRNGYVSETKFADLIKEKMFKDVDDLYKEQKKIGRRMYYKDYNSDDSISDD